MSESRRRFLKRASSMALGAGAGIPLLDAAARAMTVAPESDENASTTQWALVIDVDKCLRDEVREACITACHTAHNVPAVPDPDDEVKWIWTEQFQDAMPDQVHSGTSAAQRRAPVLVLCNHCTNPPCVRVCPTGATWKRETDGVVMMDQHRCIGCRYCMAACPYGARSFNWRDPRPYVARRADGEPLSAYPTRTTGVVEKCNFCADRIRAGQEPACVEAARNVPGGEGALTFGDLSDPTSRVRDLLDDHRTVVRRISLGTGPNVFYIV